MAESFGPSFPTLPGKSPGSHNAEKKHSMRWSQLCAVLEPNENQINKDLCVRYSVDSRLRSVHKPIFLLWQLQTWSGESDGWIQNGTCCVGFEGFSESSAHTFQFIADSCTLWFLWCKKLKKYSDHLLESSFILAHDLKVTSGMTSRIHAVVLRDYSLRIYERFKEMTPGNDHHT